MKRGTGLAPMSAKRRALLAAEGNPFPTSTFASKPKMATAKRASTGPTRSVAELLAERSGGMCEWTDCPAVATDKHHRLNRKNGGRHGEMRERLNGVAWLLHACRVHHAFVTSPFGRRREVARERGWLLEEHEDAAQVPVWTRHSDQPVYLTADGLWVLFEEACA